MASMNEQKLQRRVKRLEAENRELHALLRQATRVAPDLAPPELPGADADGNFPALETVGAILARKLIARRQAAGLTQGQLAERAGVRLETISRLETGKHSPTVRTVEKIDQALTDSGAPDVRLHIGANGKVTARKVATAQRGKTGHRVTRGKD